MSQFELSEFIGQLQGLLDALCVFACGLSRHVFPASFSIQQRAHFLNPLVGFQTLICNLLQQKEME